MEMSARQEVLDLLKHASERDLQTTVGPSSLGSLCSYCLAREMRDGQGGQGRYWLGARIGTAVHREMENLVIEHRPETEPEKRVYICTIEGYGEIWGTSDWLVDTDVRDFKTTTRDKLVFIKRAIEDEPDEFDLSKVVEARFKIAGYWNQGLLYGYGMEKLGHEVKSITLIFICRDGKTDDDIWAASIDYDIDAAEKIIDRARRLWQYLEEGNDIEALTSAPGCYTCTTEGRL